MFNMKLPSIIRKILSKKSGKRTYKAASINRLTADWSPIEISNNQVVYQSLNILRSRSRTCVRNDVYARRFLQLLDQNVVGHTGIKLVPQVKRGTGEADEPANTGISRAWKAWSRPVNCDSTGRNSYREIQRIMLRNMATDGESIARIILSREASPYGLSLQMIDPEFLDKEKNADLQNGNKIRMGIEFNRFDRPVAYWFLDGSQTNVNRGNTSSRANSTIRVPANEIIHLFVTEFPGQIRGIPWLSTALIQMHNLDGYQDAAVMNARIGASKMGFFTNDSGEMYEGQDDGAGGVNMDVSPGTFEELPPGWSLTEWDPTYPHDQYPEFVKATLRGVAAGLGVTYHTLASDLSDINFSAGRLGAQEDREFYSTLQEFMNEHFNSEVFEAWLPYSLLNGAITSDRGRPLPFSLLEKLDSIAWRGRRWAHIEPLKEMQAAKEAYFLGVKSKSQIIRDGGGEPDEVFAEIEQDLAKSPTIVDDSVNKETEALLLEEEQAEQAKEADK